MLYSQKGNMYRQNNRPRIPTVWSESSLGAFWIIKNAEFLHADKEDSDQTARTFRLILAFVGRTFQKVRLTYQQFRLKKNEWSAWLDPGLFCNFGPYFWKILHSNFHYAIYPFKVAGHCIIEENILIIL